VRALVILIAGTLFCASTLAWTQPEGRIRLAADVGGLSCNIDDAAPGILYVHMLITERTDVTGVQFAAPKPACWVGATWLSDQIAFPVYIGDSQNNFYGGLSIGLGSCLSSPIYLGAIVYMTQGQAQPCCVYPVVKTYDLVPGIPTPIVATCDFVADGINAGYAVVNAQPNCSCDEPVSTEDRTWGALKALYE